MHHRQQRACRLIRRLGTAGLAVLLWPAAVMGQEPSRPPPSIEEVQATIARMRAKLDAMGVASAKRDQSLRFLQ